MIYKTINVTLDSISAKKSLEETSMYELANSAQNNRVIANLDR